VLGRGSARFHCNPAVPVCTQTASFCIKEVQADRLNGERHG
jgi:hypothetical protein